MELITMGENDKFLTEREEHNPDEDGAMPCPPADKPLDNAPSSNKRHGRKRRGRKVLLAVALLLLVVVGGSTAVYATQHNNPQFCNAVCHQPMDPYVDGYYSGDTSLLVTAHQDDGVTCLQCHDASFQQQLDEGIKWATGDFSDPMEVRRFANEGFCLVEGCHVSFDKLTQITENYQGTNRNPHESPHGKNECYNCHSVHQESRLYCSQCHTDVTAPMSWR